VGDSQRLQDEAACSSTMTDLMAISCAIREKSPLLWPPEVAQVLGQVLITARGSQAGSSSGPQAGTPRTR
jgi:hypothetical protein